MKLGALLILGTMATLALFSKSSQAAPLPRSAVGTMFRTFDQKGYQIAQSLMQDSGFYRYRLLIETGYGESLESTEMVLDLSTALHSAAICGAGVALRGSSLSLEAVENLLGGLLPMAQSAHFEDRKKARDGLFNFLTALGKIAPCSS